MWFEPTYGELPPAEVVVHLDKAEGRALLAALQEWRAAPEPGWQTEIASADVKLTIAVGPPAASSPTDTTVDDEAVSDEQVRADVVQDWWEAYGETELRHLLLLWWDPVGVYGDSGGLTEYETELRPLVESLKQGAAGVDAIYAFLRSRGLPLQDARDQRAARLIAEWYERAMRRLFGPWPVDSD